MNTLKILLAIVLSLFISACGTLSNRTGVETLSAAALNSPNAGVVVLSVGAPERCISQATFLSIRDLTTKKPVESVPLIGVDVYAHQSDFSDHHGTVNAFQLPPGSYYLTPSIANMYVHTVSAPTFEFDVKAGETTYLGELFMTRACALNTSFEVRDQYDRDMVLVSKKNAAAAARPAVKRLLKPGVPSSES